MPTETIVKETAVSSLINMTISAGFFVLLFGNVDAVPFRGAGNLIFDGLPQGFMIGAMSALVPVLLVRKRLGSAMPFVGTRVLVMRALAAGLLGVAVIVGLTTLLSLVAAEPQIAFALALAFKMIAGGAVGAMTTLTSLRLAAPAQAA